MAVTLAIYATGSISGTHANPAVTLTLALFRGFPWKKVVPYWIAQVVGGFLGAVIVYALFFPVIDHFNAAHHLTRPDSIQTAGVFFTHPGLAITPLHALSDQIILTAFLLFGIFAITEQYNEMAPGANFGAVMIGLLVAIIGACMGYLEAWAINPARDFGPRLFAYFAGWGPGCVSLAGQLLVGADRRPADRRRHRRSGLPDPHPPLPAGAGARGRSRAHPARAQRNASGVAGYLACGTFIRSDENLIG